MENKSETSHIEKEKKSPKRVFVEIGPNEMPVPLMGDRVFGPDDLYIGIDTNTPAMRDAQQQIKGEGLSEENILFMRADAARLPIPDRPVSERGVHEVYMGNVLGDPHITTQDQFIAEAERILALDGRLVIMENNTPADRAFVESLLARHGFTIDDIITSDNPAWPDTVRQYSRAAAAYDRRGHTLKDYLIFASRNSK